MLGHDVAKAIEKMIINIAYPTEAGKSDLAKALAYRKARQYEYVTAYRDELAAIA